MQYTHVLASVPSAPDYFARNQSLLYLSEENCPSRSGLKPQSCFLGEERVAIFTSILFISLNKWINVHIVSPMGLCSASPTPSLVPLLVFFLREANKAIALKGFFATNYAST